MTLLGTVPGNGQTSFLIRFGEHSVNEQRADYSRQGKGRAELPNRSGMPSKLIELSSQILLSVPGEYLT